MRPFWTAQHRSCGLLKCRRPQHPYRILFRSPQDLEPPGIMKDPVKPFWMLKHHRSSCQVRHPPQCLCQNVFRSPQDLVPPGTRKDPMRPFWTAQHRSCGLLKCRRPQVPLVPPVPLHHPWSADPSRKHETDRNLSC